MKKSYTIILCLFTWIVSYSQLSVFNVVKKNSNNPQTGAIIFKEGSFGCPPYFIELRGQTIFLVHRFGNVNPGNGNTFPVTGLDADIYKILIVDANSCSFRDEREVEFENCDFNVTVVSSVGCNNIPATVEVSIPNRPKPIAYEYFLKGSNNRIALRSHNNLNDIIALGEGEYIVKVTDSLGCLRMSNFKVTNFDFTSTFLNSAVYNNKWKITLSVTDKNNKTIVGRNFDYRWSNGVNNLNKPTSIDINFANRIYTNAVTITDVQSRCTSILNIPQSSPPLLGVYLNDIRHDYNKIALMPQIVILAL